MRKAREYKETAVARSQCPICLAMYIVGEKSCDCPVGHSLPNPTKELREARGYNTKSRKRNGY